MHRVIYADTLVFLNTVVTFIILLTVRQLSGIKTSEGRLVSASFLGGIFSLVIFAPELGLPLTLLLKFLIGSVIVLTAFCINGGKKFIRCFAMFLAISFLYGGVTFAAAGISGGRAILYKNGFGYVGLSFGTILILCAAVYLAVKILKRKFSAGKEHFRYKIELTYRGRTVEGEALFDSGNFVSDCYTGKPVIIADGDFVMPLLSSAEQRELAAVSERGFPEDSVLKLRLLPVRTVSGSKMLPAFTCDKAVIRNEDKYITVVSPSLAVAGDFGNTECNALINENIFC